MPPWLLIPESATNIYHGLIDAGGNLQIHADLWERFLPRRRLDLQRLVPGSLSLTLAGLSHGKSNFLKAISGLAPTGFISTDPIKETVHSVATDGGWIQHPNTWIVACDYQTGDRVVFGAEGAPPEYT